MFSFGEGRSRSATCYLRRGRVYLHASSKTLAGFYIATPPFLVVDLADGGKLDNCIKAALTGSRDRVPTPPRDAELLLELYKLAGIATWGSFVRGAKLTHVDQLPTGLRFRPTRNGGARAGFEDMPDAAFQVSSDVAAGLALVKAFDLSL